MRSPRLSRPNPYEGIGAQFTTHKLARGVEGERAGLRAQIAQDRANDIHRTQRVDRRVRGELRGG